MNSGIYYLEIFLIGLFGSMHCIGMCGGFVAMYSMKTKAGKPSPHHHILYNIGRTTTYSLLGGTIGFAGSFTAYLATYRAIPGAALLAAGAFMIIMGMNIAGLMGGRSPSAEGEIATSPVFRKLLRAVLSLDSRISVFLFGMFLGLLPCGLLYPVLISAAVSGSFTSGMFTLAVFGVGTTPALLFFGYLMSKLQPHMRLFLYRMAAFIIIILGIQTLLRGMAFMGWISAGRFW